MLSWKIQKDISSWGDKCCVTVHFPPLLINQKQGFNQEGGVSLKEIELKELWEPENTSCVVLFVRRTPACVNGGFG